MKFHFDNIIWLKQNSRQGNLKLINYSAQSLNLGAHSNSNICENWRQGVPFLEHPPFPLPIDMCTLQISIITCLKKSGKAVMYSHNNFLGELAFCLKLGNNRYFRYIILESIHNCVNCVVFNGSNGTIS